MSSGFALRMIRCMSKYSHNSNNHAKVLYYFDIGKKNRSKLHKIGKKVLHKVVIKLIMQS